MIYNGLAYNLFSFSGLVLGITCTLMSMFLLIYGRTNLHRVLAFFNIAVGIWGYGAFNIGRQQDQFDAIIAWRIAFIGVIFIAVFFYHGMCLFVQKNRSKVIIFSYVQGILFLILNFTDLYISNVFYFRDSFYYLKSSGLLFPLSFIIWFMLVVAGFIEVLVYFITSSEGIKKQQASYILFSFGIGFVGGTTNFFPMFGINIIPFGNVTIPFYSLMMTYAMLRYKILDLKLVVTRLGIYVAVYAFVLGVPIWVGFKLLGFGAWFVPTSMMAYFAISGPFIYFYIQKRAEDRLLKEQKTYQATLRQASVGMGKIKDIKKLLHMIVFILARTVRLEHAVIYMYDDVSKEYIFGAIKQRSSDVSFVNKISSKSPLIGYLSDNHNSIISEELKQKAQDFRDVQLVSVVNNLQELHATLVVPIYISNRLFAMVIMGKKESGKTFNEDDLAVFSILANQAALAIENARFYEDMKITQQQLFQAEKMATIGIMADGLSHQINNRFHALGFIAGDALDTIKLSKNLEMSDKVVEMIQYLEKALNRVQDNVIQGGEVVQGLLKYTRKGEEGFVAIDVDAVISNAYEMAQFKIKTSQMSLVRNYDLNLLPKVKGNFTQLQEVFFNLIDNAYDAMMQRKNEVKEPDYHPKLTIHAKAQGKNLEMIFEDNGMGVKEEDVAKLFTPFFTTKLSSKKGTGLGLYVIRKIIEDNHGGKVEFSSKHMVGTQMRITLPLIAGG